MTAVMQDGIKSKKYKTRKTEAQARLGKKMWAWSIMGVLKLAHKCAFNSQAEEESGIRLLASGWGNYNYFRFWNEREVSPQDTSLSIILFYQNTGHKSNFKGSCK